MHKDDLWHRLHMLLDPSTQVFGSFCVRLNLDGKMHKLEVVKKTKVNTLHDVFHWYSAQCAYCSMQ